MSLLNDALRAGNAPAQSNPRGRPGQLLIAGGAGPLGSAVLEHALAARHWASVSALVTQPIEVALRGLLALQVSPDLSGQLPSAAMAETALVVFDRERSLHGREAAFLRPQPEQLGALARWLHAHGVRRLLLVLPHAPSLLPQALKAGLANLDEQAVAALGFEQLVVVRPTRTGVIPPTTPAQGAAAPNAFLTWLARGILAQLSFMVPQRDQPLRAAKVAQFVIALAQALPQAAAGTRIAPPELLWDWAQADGGDAVLQGWLQHGHWTPVAAPIRRY
jgi:hypothetical protein